MDIETFPKPQAIEPGIAVITEDFIITVMFLGGVSVLYYVDLGSLLFVLELGLVLSLVSHDAHDFFGAYRTAIND